MGAEIMMPIIMPLANIWLKYSMIAKLTKNVEFANYSIGFYV
jgi:hypothetical protein